MAALLLDISCLCDAHTDATLEFMTKAIGEEPAGVDIWALHPNPFIRRLVELFTQRGLDRIAGLQEELGRWLSGAEHIADLARPARPAGAMARWSQAELAISRLYLQSLPTEEFTLDDWLMVVDYLVQRYLPETDLRSEADWLATRASLMGRVHAAMGDISAEHADTVLAALPEAAAVGMTTAQRAVIDFGRARCAEHVTALADGARHRMRNLIVDYQENLALGNRAGTSEALEAKLLDEFGTMNRDWRRIAVTEAGENENQGFVASVGPGVHLKRVEKYLGACPFCRMIDGMVCTVVDPASPDKNGDTDIWPGKTNIGRSASPRKRVGGALVEREPPEMWWIAAGVQHPNCRGSWIKAAEGASPDPVFDAWLADLEKNRGRK